MGARAYTNVGVEVTAWMGYGIALMGDTPRMYPRGSMAVSKLWRQL